MSISRRQITFLIAGSGLCVALAFAIFAWRNGRVSVNPHSLLQRLPTQDAVVAGFDFDAVRRSGYLALFSSSKVPEEPEYAGFVKDTGFDYKRDLDYVLASFAPDGEFFLVRGTFDWPRLERYALSQKGSCFQHLCRLAGSRPERKISFFPLRPNLMAMAVAPDDTAATRLLTLGPQGDITVPAQPVWLTFSAGALRNSPPLPGSSKLFASAIVDANRVTFTMGPAGKDLEARVDAICRDAQQAGALTMQLQTLTSMLRKARPGSAGAPATDIAGLLTTGKFEQAGSHVLGNWPVQHSLLANLAGEL